MHTDVTDLRNFYQTPLGLMARRILTQKIRARWPRLDGLTLAGFGFASPFLGSFRTEALRIAALMPEGQGALVWPSSDRNMTVLVEEEHWPLPDNSMDRILVIHGLETSNRPAVVLREMWRVLAPSGRLLIVVPNRSGVWARTDRTPFGQGRPFSRGQLEQQLRDSLFTPVGWDSALHLPPIDRGIVVRYGPTFEKVGERVFRQFAGVMMVEATKELIAPIGKAMPALAAQKLNPITATVRPRGRGIAAQQQRADLPSPSGPCKSL
ncbi:MAG: class I SAM-dependent methyltransferase [Hyphomicrobium aestuarii]|nr:class I SAM-dependent methyltransferase [Hyphomicrobium aestuarii]